MQRFNLKQKIQEKLRLTRIVKQGGFSLFELLIYVAVLAVILVVISNVLISISDSNARSQVKSEVNSSIRFASELLQQDIKNASSVSVPTNVSSSPTITLVRDGVEITYDTSGGFLRRKEGVSVPINITNSNVVVGTPVFTRIENTNAVFNKTNVSIKIYITFSYNSAVPNLTYSTSLENTINLY